MKLPSLPGSADPILKSQWTNVQGYRVHLRFSNQEPDKSRFPVILVHGLSMSSRYMLPTARRLAAQHCVYALDLPGFGKSEKPRKVLSISELAEILLGWIDKMKFERAIFLGNSLGCQIILELALRHPERIASMILVGPTVDPAGRLVRRLFLRTIMDAMREPPGLLAIALHDYLVAGIPRTFRTLDYTVQDVVESKLPRVRVPALIVRGVNDVIVPQAWVEEVHRLMPNSRLAVLPDSAHGTNYSHADQLAQLVESFIKDRVEH